MSTFQWSPLCLACYSQFILCYIGPVRHRRLIQGNAARRIGIHVHVLRVFIAGQALVSLRPVGSAKRGNRLGLQRPVDVLHDPDELCAQVTQFLPPPCVTWEVDFLPRRRRGAQAALGAEDAVAAARRRFHDLLGQLNSDNRSPRE